MVSGIGLRDLLRPTSGLDYQQGFTIALVETFYCALALRVKSGRRDLSNIQHRQYLLSGVGRWQKVCVGGGGGEGTHRHVIYVPSVKNQYKRVVFGYMTH